MAEQDVAKLSLNFSTNVKDSDVDSVDRLFSVLDKLDNLNISETKIKNLSILSRTLKGFNGIKIGANLGKGILGIVQASNQIADVKDISPYAETLNKNFQILGQAARNFNDVMAKIPVNMGKGILGIIDATNHIDKVKDISGVANRLNNNFRIIAQATSHFSVLDRTDYSGMARLVSAMTSVSKIKPIGNTVIKNAEKLAKAVNILSTNVNASTPRLTEMAKVTNNLGAQFNRTSTSARKFNQTMSLVKLAVTIRAARTLINLFKRLVMKIYSFVEAWGEVENTLSFFSQAMGTQAESTAKVIQGYSDLGVVDFSKFSNQVAKLTQIYKGYGIASEDAAKMALNLTQLAVDASYALGENGKDVDLWNQRITAVATGQTRAGYYFGVDTSVKALSEGFDELSANTDKATRSMAAHEAMLKNTTSIQNQMAREIGTTYVQMNILRQRITQLKQSIGYALVPAFQTLIRWGLIAVKVIELLVDSIVKFFGGEGFKLIDYSSMIQNTADSTAGLGNAAEDVANGFGSANKKVKELRKTISGIDQVFTINDILPDSRGGTGVGASGIGAIGGSLSDFEWDFGDAIDGIEEINKRAEEIADRIEKAVPWAIAFGAALAAWKIAKSLLNNLEWMSKLKFAGITELSGLTLGTGFLLFISNLEKFVKYFQDFMENGATFDNVTGMLSSFAGTLGSIFIMFGNIKWGGALILVQGLIDIVAGIKDMSENGINWENVSRTLDGISNVAIGIGIIKQNWSLVGTGLVMQGAIRIIDEIKNIKEAIDSGDWSGVDKINLFIGVVMVVGGLAIGISNFVSKLKKGKTLSDLAEAPQVTQTVSTSTGGVSTKMADLAKNVWAGVGVLAGVAAAAIIFVGAIWVVGELLQKVGEAWGPVIDDGKNIALAIGAGTLLLAAVGLAAWGLGTLTLSGVGTSIPLAIAVGTGMLLLLGGATKLFIDEITNVGNKLTKELHPVLEEFNEILPDLNTNMRNYTKFMLEFAGHVAAQTAGDALSGLAGIIDTIIGFFTKDPIKSMADDVKKNHKQFDNLNDQLEKTNPLISKASDLMKEYESLLSKMKKSADKAAKVGSPKEIGISFKDFSKSLRDGFDDLDKVKTSNVEKIMSALNSIDLAKFRGIGTSIVEAMELGINNYRFSFKAATDNIKLGLTFNATYIGTDIAKDVVKGINDHWFNLLTFVNKIKQGLSFNATSIGADVAGNVVSGINDSTAGVSTFTGKIRSNLQFNANSIGTNIASNVIRGINGAGANTNTFNTKVKNSLNFSSNYIGNNIATGVIKGINAKYVNVNTFTNNVKNAMNRQFEVRSPSRWGKRLGDNVGNAVAMGINDTKVSFSTFKDTVSAGLGGIIDGVQLGMPTLDTGKLAANVSGLANGLSANVQGSFEDKTDGTEQAINRMADIVTERIERLISVTEDGQVIMVDEKVLGETSKKYAQQQAVRNNVVFRKG